MATFTIYPKEGEPFDLEFEKFDFDGKTFTLFDAAPTQFDSGPVRFVRGAFLRVDHVAAIIPVIGKDTLRAEMRFRVYLKNRADPVEVDADYFDLDPESQSKVIFYQALIVHSSQQKKEIENVYIV